MSRRSKVTSAFVLTLSLLFVYSEVKGRTALRRQLDRIAREETPTAEPVAGEDPWLFLAAIEGGGPYWTRRELWEIQFDELVTRLDERGADPSIRERIERLDEFARTRPDYGAWVGGLHDRLRSGARTSELTPEERLYLRVVSDGLTGVRTELMRAAFARPLVPADRERFTREVGLAHGTALRALAEDVSYAAADGRVAEAVRMLQAAFAMHRVLDGLPSARTQQSMESWDLFHASRSIVSHATSEVDLESLEDALERFDPRTRLVAALRSERAEISALIANRDYAALDMERPPFMTRVGAFFSRTHDRAQYLDRMTRVIEWTEDPVRHAMPVFDEPPAWMPFTEASFSFVGLAGRLASQFEAERALALAAITARRDGFEAALDICDAEEDPMGTGPLGARIDEHGTLIIWSVGMNGVDESGDPKNDLVWSIPRRES